MLLRVSLAVTLAALLWITSAGLSVTQASNTPVGSPIAPADYDLPNGHFYTEANGGASDPTLGYSVTDEAGIAMWSESQRLGGVGQLGYPVSRRFQLGPFIAQAFQKAILQWQPDRQRAVLANVMDLLHDVGADEALQAADAIPPRADLPAAPGASWDQVVQSRLKLLDFPNAGLKRTFFSATDPVSTFGLPTSPITDEGASYVIRLQRTALQLWKTDQPWAKANTVTIVNAGDLAKQNGLIPSDAMQPEASRIAVGQAANLPWSGWWWPSLDSGSGPHLFDVGGPLDKYDAYVSSTTGVDPQTRQWELAHFSFSDPKLDWAGKCNGWAVAALVEPEPRTPRTVNGITFTIADQKGLLADYYFAAPAATRVGGKDGGVTAADFHRTILDWVGKQRKGLVMNAFDGTNQVASFAIYKYQAIYMPDPAAPDTKTHVRMTVWAADYHVAPNFVGLQNWPNNKLKTYSYFIYGPRDNPTGGEWEGDSVAGPYAHPEDLWYPDLSPGARNLFGTLTSPRLDYGTIEGIIQGK